MRKGILSRQLERLVLWQAAIVLLAVLATPVTGQAKCYIGAYIEQDPVVAGDIALFKINLLLALPYGEPDSPEDINRLTAKLFREGVVCLAYRLKDDPYMNIIVNEAGVWRPMVLPADLPADFSMRPWLVRDTSHSRQVLKSKSRITLSSSQGGTSVENTYHWGDRSPWDESHAYAHPGWTGCYGDVLRQNPPSGGRLL